MARKRNSRANSTNRSGGPRTNCKREGKGKDFDVKEDPKKSGNDPAWYAANPTILKDAASYPFSYSTGATEIHDPSAWSGTDINTKPQEQVPGICSLHIYPTVGTALTPTDPINVAAQSVYSFVRHANSGHSNYDAPDLMLYILAMANMYSFLVWCQRCYGYALTYDQRNRYLPADLLRTNDVDADDLRNNLANFRFWVNTLIAKMASFAVPATMSIFSRMSFLYSDYYIEGTSIKEQLYQYVPDGFYKFGIDANQLGNLTWEPFDYTTPMTVSDIMTYGDDLFDAIWSQEDFGIMSGDILKAYGDNIIKLVQIPEYYNIIPKFDAMVLTQMKNADLVRLDPGRISQSSTSACILQTLVPLAYTTSDTYIGGGNFSSGAVLHGNHFMVDALKDYRILTVDTDDPTPEVVIEATRLKVGYDPVKSWYKAGTEMVTKVILTTKPSTDIEVKPYNIGYSADAQIIPTLAMLEAAKDFHYMPGIWVFFFDGSDNGIISHHYDIDNFTLLSFEDVKKLHEAATVNMFAVPSVGKVM